MTNPVDVDVDAPPEITNGSIVVIRKTESHLFDFDGQDGHVIVDRQLAPGTPGVLGQLVDKLSEPGHGYQTPISGVTVELLNTVTGQRQRAPLSWLELHPTEIAKRADYQARTRNVGAPDVSIAAVPSEIIDALQRALFLHADCSTVAGAVACIDRLHLEARGRSSSSTEGPPPRYTRPPAKVPGELELFLRALDTELLQLRDRGHGLILSNLVNALRAAARTCGLT